MISITKEGQANTDNQVMHNGHCTCPQCSEPVVMRKVKLAKWNATTQTLVVEFDSGEPITLEGPQAVEALRILKTPEIPKRQERPEHDG